MSLAATFIEVPGRKNFVDLLHVDNKGAIAIGRRAVKDGLGRRGQDKQKSRSLDNDPEGSASDSTESYGTPIRFRIVSISAKASSITKPQCDRRPGETTISLTRGAVVRGRQR